MDPQQAWFELIAAFHAGDWPCVRERADALLEWMQQVGFPPETLFPVSAVGDRSLDLPQTLGDDWNRTVATAACRFARKMAAAHIGPADS